MKNTKFLTAMAVSLSMIMAFGSTSYALEFKGDTSASNSGYIWNHESKTLELNGANINDGIFFEGMTGEVKINYEGSNRVLNDESNAISYSGGKLTIKTENNESSLSLSSNANADWNNTIYAGGDLVIEGGNVSVESKNNSGISAYGDIVIKDATVDIKAAKIGINPYRHNTYAPNSEVIINNSKVTINADEAGIQYGLYGELKPEPGDVSINGNKTSEKGGLYKDELEKSGKIEISENGTVKVNGEVINGSEEPEKPEKPEKPESPQYDSVVERVAAVSYVDTVKNVETSFLKSVENIPNEGSVIFDLGASQSITPKMIDAMKRFNKVTFIFTAKYNGQLYRIAIPAGSNLDKLQRNASGDISVATLIKVFKGEIIG